MNAPSAEKPASDAAIDAESPCISVCELNDDEVCLGCGRTINEIVEWGAAGPERRRQINSGASARREQLNANSDS